MGGDLHIESQQDRIKSKSHQGGVRVHVEGGFGSAWQFSGSASLSGGNAYYEQVKEQSGLFIGDGGYHIKANNVNLVGGVISSTNTVNSELITNQITFRDIDNRSDYGAFSGSLEGSISGKQAKNTENQPSSSQSEKNGKAQSLGKTLSTGLPLGSFGHDSSVTKSTLTEGRIVLNKDSAPIETSAAALGINTELSHSNRQVAEVKDIQGVLKEQKIIQASVSEIRKAVGVYGATKAQELNDQATQAQQAAEKALQQGDKHQAEQHMAQAIALQTEADKWRIGGAHRRLAEAITTGLGLVLAGKPTESIATGVASPYINQAIKQATEQYPELNIPAHILWGAIEAELLGGQASTGAVAAGVGELGAKVISEQLYGKSASELTEQEKQEVLVLSQLAGAVAGGLSQSGQDSISLGHSATLGGEVSRNAVENNFLSEKEIAILERINQKKVLSKQDVEMISYYMAKDKISDDLLVRYQTDPTSLTSYEVDQLKEWVAEWLNNNPGMMLSVLSSRAEADLGPKLKVFIPGLDEKYRRYKAIYNSTDYQLAQSTSEGLFLLSGGTPLSITSKGSTALNNLALQSALKVEKSTHQLVTKGKIALNEGIYYSYNPQQLGVVNNVANRVEKGLQSISEITPTQYAQGAFIGGVVNAGAQYLDTGRIDPEEVIKVGLSTPYIVYPSLGASISAGAISANIDANLNNKSPLYGQDKMFRVVL
ncbi:VENN motif-containing pre-toxin protein [Volucribacter psittacicida]|uniref:VENN motif-containing pre-toxin protein n=1 Tax=Volucribacter psittacicida TaxID=203482 RepID=A0A4R1G477_9PAST|nr:VENN motif-containing pre-toxin protein [Volucribacter psittacicida]